MRSDHEPCMQCRQPTGHKSGKCMTCRDAACRYPGCGSEIRTLKFSKEKLCARHRLLAKEKIKSALEAR